MDGRELYSQNVVKAVTTEVAYSVISCKETRSKGGVTVTR